MSRFATGNGSGQAPMDAGWRWTVSGPNHNTEYTGKVWKMRPDGADRVLLTQSIKKDARLFLRTSG